MQAIVHDRYGSPDILRLREFATPAIGPDEVLIRTRAASLHPGDLFAVLGSPFVVRLATGLRRPKHGVPGFDVAGTVKAVGTAVTDLRPGDEVFGVGNGTCAQLVRAKAEFVIARPASIGAEEAAAIPTSALAALHGLRDAGGLRPGQRLLVNGASGGVGSFAVQLGKILGAEVTGVCSTANVELVRSLGADRVIDYTREDLTAVGETFDVVFDAVGKTSFRRCRRLVRKGGVFVETDLGWLWQNPLLSLFTWRLAPKRVMMPLPRYRKQEVRFVKELLQGGSYRAVIDRRYPLDQVVEATRYVETERKLGNVVLTL
jgi:NADPH:quinone reductase-like Zn-dependent oxidoreductase